MSGLLVVAGIVAALVVGRALEARRQRFYDEYRARHARRVGNACICPVGVPCPCACHEPRRSR